MELKLKYRSRLSTTEDIELINRLIANNPNDSRWALSIKFCKAAGWVQPNGALRDMVCRGYMLELEHAGYIKLPPKRTNPANPFANRKKPEIVSIDKTPISTNLKEVVPLEFCQVRRSSLEKLFNSLISQYHYLGYTQPVGKHLKYMVFAGEKPFACLAFSSAARHIGPRDRFIGWDQERRRRNIHLIC